MLVDWERSGRDCVGMLRFSSGRPRGPLLDELISELSVRSPQFRRRSSAPASFIGRLDQRAKPSQPRDLSALDGQHSVLVDRYE